MRNCASGNLEIPGLVLSHHPGMTEQAAMTTDNDRGIQLTLGQF
jgi:hypothetical protein